MSIATVEDFATVEEFTTFALRDPLGFIELGVSLGGATREEALTLLKQGIDYVEAEIGKPLHELARRARRQFQARRQLLPRAPLRVCQAAGRCVAALHTRLQTAWLLAAGMRAMGMQAFGMPEGQRPRMPLDGAGRAFRASRKSIVSSWIMTRSSTKPCTLPPIRLS
jgi:hypothetical protein